MVFHGPADEYLSLEQITKNNQYMLQQPIPSGLSILWNLESEACVIVDGMEYCLAPNQLMFTTEFHRIDATGARDLRLIRFNRPFYCIIDHDAEVSCKGILFFGASNVPVINIPQEEIEKFDLLWKMFSIELETKDSLQVEMLQMMLKRLLILSTRLYKEQNQVISIETSEIDIVREFNFLVETHYKSKHTVAEYADMLNRSPKTLSNLFSKYGHKTPLEIIQERRILEARRSLRYTNKSIKEIAYELEFEDLQSFSRFFKNKESMSPKEYREKITV